MLLLWPSGMNRFHCCGGLVVGLSIEPGLNPLDIQKASSEGGTAEDLIRKYSLKKIHLEVFAEGS